MLNIATVCVNADTYMDGHAVEAIEILYSMVRRNLQAGFKGRFVVFTDTPERFADMAGVQTRLLPPGIPGWFNKLALFAPDAFQKGERVLYFDLDTAITGGLDEIAAYDGPFAILADIYRPNGLQSSVMAWEAGNWTDVFWKTWNISERKEYRGGDQALIEEALDLLDRKPDILQFKYPSQFKSYKLDCRDFVPRGTRVVFFHGFPKPHQCDGWVKDVWKVSDKTMFFTMNVKEDQVRSNIQYSLTKPKWLVKRDGTQFPAIIVGGGPSLASDLWRIRGYQLSGAVIFATNNTFRYLKENGITADAHVMHDARAANLEFVPSEGDCYYASQCHPSVLDAAGDRLICWHPYSDTCKDVIGNDPKGPVMVAGGSTIGLNAIALAYILGHRQFMLFGLDSSYSDGTHHAYVQKLNDGELVLKYEAAGQIFDCAPWMIQQAEQFMALAQVMIRLGCTFAVGGTGLLPTVAANAQPEITPADLRAKSILDRLKDRSHPVGAEIGVFAGELSSRLLQRGDLSLYLVDSWATSESDSHYTESGDFHSRLSQGEQERFYGLARELTAFAGQRAKILRKPSIEAAEDIPDGSLDFVFIDADHSYEGCKADIEAWSPKVKPGGLIAGHDYENTAFPKFGVKRAVDEKFPHVDLGDNFTWFVRK